MEMRAGADSRAMQVTEAPFGHGSHRVVDPADPPRELSGLAWGVFVSLGLLALLSIARLVTAAHLHSVVTGRGDITGAYHTYNTWVGLSGLVFLLSAGVFIAWFFRAYKNLHRLGVANLRYGTGWAIGSWFVPILSLVRPKQIANDVWRGSERGVETSTQWRLVEVPSLVHWWWGLFLTQGFLVYIGQRTTDSGYGKLTSFTGFESGLSQIKTGTTMDVLGEIVSIAAVAVAIMVVSRVTERLDEIRDEALAAGSAYSYAPPAMAPAMTSVPPPVAPTTMSYPPQAPAPPPPATSMPMQPPPPQPHQPLAEQRIQCPECAEWIQPQANVCRFCGHRLR
jgi:hypothetical protein